MQGDRRLQFVHKLEYDIRSYIAILEALLGPRDNRFVFHTVGVTTGQEDVPHLYFPNGYYLSGNCPVDVHVSRWPWKHFSPDQSVWQVAHESVHLLDPGKLGSANFLEEGLAAWFQDEPQFHNEQVRHYITKNKERTVNYMTARELVRSCMPRLCSAVRELRAAGVRIGDIEADHLGPHLPDVERDTIEQLCTPFPVSGG